eukprot:5603-Heterococcus_DN1.PRE.1
MADAERMDEDAMQQDDAAIENRIAVIKRGREEDSEEGSKRLRIETQAALGIKSSCGACNSSDRLCERSEQCITNACLAEAILILMPIVQAQGVQRTSGLVAPTMLLTGHAAPVYSLTFDPSGKHLASGSFDKSILLWDVYAEGGSNYNVLRGHKNAVLQVHWSADGAYIASASADKTVGLWDAHKGT